MSFAEKIMELRKQKGWSQEELGERLGVTRQTVSKWELGMTTPEMEKLAAMSELFEISLDELVRGGSSTKEDEFSEQKIVVVKRSMFVNGEFKSKKTWCGKPFVHINLKGRADGFLAIGLLARGIFSIGLLSMGVVSIGLLSLGVLVIGAVAAAGVAVDAFIAAGIFAFGGVAVGVFAFGGVAIGWLTYGGASIGAYAIGGYAHGKIAIGGYADGIIAFGDKMSGEVQLPFPITVDEFAAAVERRLPNTPKFIVDLFSWFASNMKSV